MTEQELKMIEERAKKYINSEELFYEDILTLATEVRRLKEVMTSMQQVAGVYMRSSYCGK